LKINNNFKEFHVKVFNTGKLEIPGIQCDIALYEILDTVINLLKPFTIDSLEYIKDTFDTVLINSNFNCGYEINREKLYTKLVDKYNVNACYDPCSYPGIQCKYYIPNGSEPTTTISYMIFRTGSILIVGKCDEDQLNEVYNYLKDILSNEFYEINQGVIDYELVKLNKNENKKKKKQKKIIYVTQ
jgi:TATA-box binding protein (TBP) (component of TFIID and TFIIIB)